MPMGLQTWCPGSVSSGSWASRVLNSPYMVAQLVQSTYNPLWKSQVLGSPEGVSQPLRPHPLPSAPFAIPSSQALDLQHPISSPPFPHPTLTHTTQPPTPAFSVTSQAPG